MVEGSVSIDQLNFAIKTVASQVHQLAAALVYPRLHTVVHLSRPVLRMGGKNQHAVSVQVERAIVKLRLGVIVVGKVPAFEPAQEPPLGGCDVAGGPAFD